VHVTVADGSLRFGDRSVFQDVQARFDSGMVSAVVGASGSGKSSLLACIAGEMALTTGTIEVARDGNNVPPDPTDVVWVPQGSNALGPRSAMDNVMIGPLAEGSSPEAAAQLAQDALHRVGLASAAHQRARTLSGGELQRLAFARALSTNRPIILADEPSASLDAQNTHALAGLLAELRPAGIIIVATHDPILIDSASCVLDLRRA